jgi:hypothetical protein
MQVRPTLVRREDEVECKSTGDIDLQSARKHTFVVIIGTSAEAENLCKRWCVAGAHVVLLSTDRPPFVGRKVIPGPPIHGAENVIDSSIGIIFPQPGTNPEELVSGDLRRRLRCGEKTKYHTTGPYVFGLSDIHTYAVSKEGIVVFDEERSIVWSLPALVVQAERGRDAESYFVGNVDSERMPFFILSARYILFWCAVYFCTMFLYLSLGENAAHSRPWSRGFLLAATVLPAFSPFLVNRGFGPPFNGQEQKGRIILISHSIIISFLFCLCALTRVSGRYLSLFWTCAIATSVSTLVLLPLHWLQTGGPIGFKWGFIVIFSSVGGWILFYSVAIAFVATNEVLPTFANLLLPLTTTVTEIALIQNVERFYSQFVHSRGASAGDQPAILCFLIGVVHSCELSTSISHCGSEYLTSCLPLFSLLCRR